MKELKAIKAALAAGPTPGPWFFEFEQYRYVISCQGAFGPYKALAVTAGFYPANEENARLIAACNPATMTAVLAHIEAQQAEIERLRDALKFYAEGDHFNFDGDAWDTVSGEPQNFWCDDAGTATVEDGTIAKLALNADMKEQP